MAIKLNLGCGPCPVQGWINVDIDPKSSANLILDLNKVPWVWADESVDEIFTSDCFEHLFPLGKTEGQMNIVAVMREVHRVLKVGSMARIRVPTTEGRGAWQDPTHVTFWNENTFKYFTEGKDHWKVLKPGFGFSQVETGHEVDKDEGVVWVEARCIK